MKRMPRACAGRCLVVCGLLVGSAHAQSTEKPPSPSEIQRARALFAEAEAFEETFQWKEALNRLEQAFAIKSTPGIRFHIGYCQEKLGAKKTALGDYRRASELAVAEKKEDVRKAAEDAIKRLLPTIPTVVIIPSVSGTTLTIDNDQATENVPFQVDAGRHSIRIEKDGFVPYADTFSIAPEERSAKIEVRLREKAASASNASDTTRRDGTAKGSLVSATGNAAQSPGPHSNTAAWLTTIGAVVLTGGGLTAFIVAGSSASGECRVTGDCTSERSTVRLLDWTAASMWTAAAGLGVFSVVLWSKGAPESGTESKPSLAAIPRASSRSKTFGFTAATTVPTRDGFSISLRGVFE